MTQAAHDRCSSFAAPDGIAQFSRQCAAGKGQFTAAEIAALLHASASQVQGELNQFSPATPPAIDGKAMYSLDVLLTLAHRIETARAQELRLWLAQSLEQNLTRESLSSKPDAPVKPSETPAKPKQFFYSILHWCHAWQNMIYFAVLMLVLTLSPSSYGQSTRQELLRQLYTKVWLVLPWFSVLCALFSLVLIRIVVVTAASYGLSRFALEMVVRVLVLELIPLGAALFVIFGMSAENRRGRLATHTAPIRPTSVQHSFDHSSVKRSDVPIVVAQSFAVITLAALSSVTALFLAYLIAYGLSPWGIAEYTRMVGRVFNLPVSLIFATKIVLFSLAVAVVPLATVRQHDRSAHHPSGIVPQATIRLFSALVVIEIASLAVKYI